jgi:dTDP-L-rhamnose 4-epimerase
MHDIDAVYFLAAGTGTGQSMYQVHRYCDVNVMGAAVFAELLPQFRDRIRKVVVSSTRAVYGEGAARCPEHGRVFPAARAADRLRAGAWEAQCPQCSASVEPLASAETDSWSPTSVYGLTKLTQEQLLVQACRHLGIPAVVFRYQNVYGPGQALRNPYTGILTIFSQVLARGEEVNVFEDGLPTRDFVHIADAVHYNVRALDSEGAGPLICNVGSGVRTTLVEVVQAIAGALGVTARQHLSGDFRAGDIRHACADLTHLTQTFGPRSFITFEKGVRSLVEWVCEQGRDGLAANAYQDSLEEMRRAGLLGKVVPSFSSPDVAAG